MIALVRPRDVVRGDLSGATSKISYPMRLTTEHVASQRASPDDEGAQQGQGQ